MPITMPSATPLILTDEIANFVNNALASGNPLLLAVVDTQGQPILSFRGSAQVYSKDQIGLWARNNQGGTLESIRHNSKVAMMYRSATTPMLQFQGRARIATDEAERTRVFENSPEREQKTDLERKGTAVIIDLDKIDGVLSFGANGPIFCRMMRA